jgi:hypothetical protein
MKISRFVIQSLALFLFLFPAITCLGQPIISSITPSSGSIGAAVTITGSGFNSGASNNIVFFGPVKAQVTNATPTSIIVTVPVGTTYQPISVTTGNFTAFSAYPFLVTSGGCGNFDARSLLLKDTINPAGRATMMSAADLDNDGKIDLVTGNGTSGSFSVFRNTSSSHSISFAPKMDISYSGNILGVGTGDLDADGKPDVIIGNQIGGKVSVFRNTSTTGNISFAPGLDYTTQIGPGPIAIADIDGDGRVDFVVNNGSNSISVYRNNTSGNTLSFVAATNFFTNIAILDMAMANLDQDGRPDIVVCGTTPSSQQSGIVIIKNNSTPGTVAFQPKIDLATEPNCYNVATGDLNGDGLPDIARVSAIGDVAVFKNTGTTGTISFAARTDLLERVGSSRISVGDITGDGKPDLTITGRAGNALNIFTNTSTSANLSFNPKTAFADQNSFADNQVVDIDLDGQQDVAVVDQFYNAVYIYRKLSSDKIFLVDASRPANLVANGVCSVTAASWQNACGSLQTALNSAKEGDQIWVAKGNYFPSADITGNSNPTDLRSLTLIMKSGVKVYGGFTGNEVSLQSRNAAINETRLNGTINTNGSINNAYNVVSFNNVDTLAILDGFTIQNGSASAGSPGGGIILNNSSPIISNCVITGNNSAGAGGGIYCNNSTPVFINCAIISNIAQTGAGLFNNNSSPQIVNCTITKNVASAGGGGVFNQASSASKIANSIIWGNSGINNAIDNIRSTNSTPIVLYSIVGDSTAIFPGVGNLNANPLFVDGENGNFTLIKGSYAIKGGDVSSFPSWRSVIDLVGNPRFENNSISIGAYQGGYNSTNSSGILYVNASSTNLMNDGNSWAAPYNSLSDAIALSNGNSSITQIWIAKGVYHPLNDQTSTFTSSTAGDRTFFIKKGVMIYGGFAGIETSLAQRAVSSNETILDGLNNYPNGATDLFLHIMTVSTKDSTIVDGITFRDGFGTSSIIGGSAIVIKDSSKIRITNCNFSGNGGNDVIFNYQSSLILTHSQLVNNETRCLFNVNATAIVSNCNFSNNKKDNGYLFGAAIDNLNSSIVVNNCLFTNNRAGTMGGEGGAVYLSNTTGSFTNCRFINNLSYTSSGAVGISSMSHASFANCVFTKNWASSGGAVSNWNSESSFINCTITNNGAYSCGGVQNLVVANGSPAVSIISNCIIWGNLSINDRSADNIFDVNTSQPVSSSFMINYSDVGLQTGIYPGTSNFNANPFFVDTVTANLDLLSNSPAIDAGNNSAYPGNINTDVDESGAPRLNGTVIDMGALEFNSTVCAGTGISFTSNLAGTSYQWLQNSGSGFTNITDNANFSGTNSAVLQISNIPVSWNTYQYRCKVDGNDGRIFIISVRNTVVPSVSINSASNGICANNQSVFTATPLNGGSMPSYQWQINGVNTGSNNKTFIPTTLNNNDLVKVIMTSNSSCLANPTSESNVIQVSVSPVVTPAVSINASSSIVCAGTNVNFTATPVNGGNAPAYQWLKNGQKVGSNTTSYADNLLLHGDLISVAMVSNAACANPVTAKGNIISIAVNTVLTPSVSISGTTTVDQGQTVTITAGTINAGTSPGYQWQDSVDASGWKNIAGATSQSINYTPAQTGNRLRCIFTSSIFCASSPLAVTSNALVFSVNSITAIDPVAASNYGIRYFPNPANSFLAIENLDLMKQWRSVEVLSANGINVIPKLTISNQTRVRLEIGSLPTGMYIGIIRSQTGITAYLKFLKL